jgi:hypothetical protein
VRVLRSQPPVRWSMVATAAPSDGWNGAWTWLALLAMPSAAGPLRSGGGADVTLPYQRGSWMRRNVMRAGEPRHLARDRAVLLPKLHAE